MYILNDTLCENINHIHMHLFHYGHAIYYKSWNAEVLNPVYSRLLYICNGNSYIVVSGKKTKLKPGNWYLIPAGCSYHYCTEGQIEHMYFHFKISSSDGMDILYNCSSVLEFKPNDNNLEVIRQGLDKTSIAFGLRIRSILYALVLDILDENKVHIENKTYSSCVIKAIDYINSNLLFGLSLEEISNNAYVSKSTLTKHFKKELSMSVGEYINDRILSESAILLLKTKMSILEISEKFGFCDRFYFSRVFSKKFGVSPLGYRKRTHN